MCLERTKYSKDAVQLYRDSIRYIYIESICIYGVDKRNGNIYFVQYVQWFVSILVLVSDIIPVPRFGYLLMRGGVMNR